MAAPFLFFVPPSMVICYRKRSPGPAAFTKQTKNSASWTAGQGTNLLKPRSDFSMDSRKRKIHGKLNASWKISSLAVNGQSFLVIDGYLLNPFPNGLNSLMSLSWP